MIECDEVMKDKIKMILDSLPEEERAELLEMYIPVHEKDIFPVVKKIYWIFEKLKEEEQDQFLKLIYSSERDNKWQTEKEPKTTEDSEE